MPIPQHGTITPYMYLQVQKHRLWLGIGCGALVLVTIVSIFMALTNHVKIIEKTVEVIIEKPVEVITEKKVENKSGTEGVVYGTRLLFAICSPPEPPDSLLRLEGEKSIGIGVFISEKIGDESLREFIKNIFELELAKNGIPISNTDSNSGLTTVRLAIEGFEHENIYTYNNTVSIERRALTLYIEQPELHESNGIWKFKVHHATLWRRSEYGFVGKSRAQEVFEHFARAKAAQISVMYHKANNNN